ncbi:EamA family transporter [Paenibacillus flagellatus]|uniref:EamA domain-containing protein n=1 Tax=Paenibacillus flagellatus TaxID=2211139 RepID=A0A2V5K378_9BACL|nr:EamA family transporter [Paenibacillus flagellatus]PYI53122.1 hypothetical protein DLM86_19225 [Paenibacillus flagellatus]
MTAIGIVLLNVTLLVGGQLLWKTALTQQPLRTLGGLPQLMTNPYVLLGGLVYAVATVIWFFALSRYDMSRIYPLQSMAYVVGAIAGIWLFKESVTVHQWIGIALIVGGACFMAK